MMAMSTMTLIYQNKSYPDTWVETTRLSAALAIVTV